MGKMTNLVAVLVRMTGGTQTPGIKEDLMALGSIPMWRRSTPTATCPDLGRDVEVDGEALLGSSHQPGGGRRGGLAISEGMRAQIRGTAQASRNAQDGISLVQTAEGSLNEMHSILQRVRELSIQFANGTLSTSDQAKITAEVAQLTAELVRIRDSSKFNGIALFSSSAATTVTIQVGANGNVDAAGNANRVGISIGQIDFSAVSMDVATIDTALTSVSNVRANLGAMQNRLEHTIANLGVSQENLSGVREPHPRRGRGPGDGELHQAPDPVPVRHGHARAGQPGSAGRSLAPALVRTATIVAPFESTARCRGSTPGRRSLSGT